VAPQPRHRSTFIVLTVAVASFALLQSLVIPVLGTLEQELGTDQKTITWVLTAYLLSASICTPILGRLGDVVGKKRMLVLTLCALSIGSLMAALSDSVMWLIVARVVQGAGGGVLPLSFGIIRDEFPREKVNSGLSITASLAAAGFGVGIVIAGPIVDLLSYHWLFWLPMIATGLAALAALTVVPESRVRTPGRIPVLPALLLSTWLVALLFGLSEGNTWGWTSPWVLGLFTAAVVLASIWVRVETRAPTPLIDMKMMRTRGVWTANVVAAFVGFGLFASFGFLPQLLQTPSEVGYGFGASVSQSGHILLPSSVASFLIGFTTSRLVRGLGTRVVIVTGALTTAAALASIAAWHDATWQLYGATTIQGIGSGLVLSSLAGVVIASVPPGQTGVASGMNANIRTIGGSIGAAFMAGVVTSRTGAGGLPVESGYVTGFVVLAIGMILAAGAAMFMPNFREQPTHDALEDADNAALGMVAGGQGLTQSGRGVADF
jgi:EmrB/QacA subfamily drug resistance transporter